jgi:beta-lactamase superfamily II metal-dependent hydrolase
MSMNPPPADPESGKPWLQVSGMFQGDDGMTMFLFSGDASKYNEEQVVKIIESIR